MPQRDDIAVAAAESSGRAADGIQPVHLVILGTGAAACAAALIAHGTRPANIVFITLVIVAAGLTTSALYRTLWPLATDVSSNEPEMLGGRTRAALEREKTITLRAIKELEFDRAMGKVSAADCDEMIGRLRARAVRLIRQLDAGSAGYRELIERELNARLGGPPARSGTALVPPEAELASPDTAPTSAVDRAPVCVVCGATNDRDARFCKGCGSKLGVPA